MKKSMILSFSPTETRKIFREIEKLLDNECFSVKDVQIKFGNHEDNTIVLEFKKRK